MELKLKKSNTNVYVISIVGELDLYQSNKLRHLIKGMISKNVNKIIFDLEETSYIDSTGLGVFISTFKQCHTDKKVKACLCNVKGTVARLVRLSKLDTFFIISDDVSTAMNLMDNI